MPKKSAKFGTYSAVIVCSKHDLTSWQKLQMSLGFAKHNLKHDDAY